ncbi:MAG: sigma 54-interacting transcriptional regulator [Bacteroidetes bacterium]|nr:sigma 54-interacting transcriptional regulator [Bacteroidota bacterium]MCB0852545.1 sigma 54-interacting transcriptional regulator [Bacteroidota bacterium]
MKAINSLESTNVLIFGAGKGGSALLELFNDDPGLNLVGIVDIDPKASGLKLARQKGIPAARSAEVFLLDPEMRVDVVVDASGDSDAWQKLAEIKPDDTRMISGIAAQFIWALLEARKDHKILEKQFEELKSNLKEKDEDKDQLLIGSSPSMQLVEQMIKQVAPTNSTVLITGETGTGKELVAQTIQQYSHLNDKPFQKINCTAFSPHLLESELFGHKKGSFTGAHKDKIGILEKGDGGTIFLDEVGDISMGMQVKLLRFLQFGEIRPVGSNHTRIVKTRIIAATNRELERLVLEEKFRDDLYYRLNIFTIELPPLRDRKEDIPLFVYHFLKIASKKLRKPVTTISPESMDILVDYQYPGNLRELQGIIERAVILCNGSQIETHHLPLNVQSAEKRFDYEEGLMGARQKVVNQFEIKAIQHYLFEAEGNVSLAAKNAKMPRRTFYRLMEKHNLSKEVFRGLMEE